MTNTMSEQEVATRYLGCRQFVQTLDSISRDSGVEPRQYELLLLVSHWERNRPPTVRDISRSLGIRHNTTVELIDRTAGKGLVERVRDAGDRRQVFLKLTAEGQRILRTVWERYREQTSPASHLDSNRREGMPVAETMAAGA
jgi:DNA-binding MarR family transcriptional regulator